jgi:hypothetical protein
MNLLSEFIFDHYIANSSLLGGRRGACMPGSKNVMFTGQGRAQAYRGPALVSSVAGGRIMFNAIDAGYASLGDATTAGVGSVFGLIARALAYIGSGPLYLNGVTRSVSASTALQMLLYRSGSYSGASTGPYAFGLEPPTAPTLAVTPTASTIMSGTYSTVHWFVRSATGGRSRRSSSSAVVVNSGFKMRHTVAGADLTYAASVGADRIGIGVTAAGFGSTGPHYEEREIAISSLTTVDTVANSVELEWSDTSLIGKDLAPILDYPPPAGVFAAAIEDVVAVIGCYGDLVSGVSTTSPGTAIAVSLPVFIESFPPDSLLFLPAPPKGVLSRASDGFVLIGGEGYVAALLYTGGKNPLSLRVLWPTTGIASPNGWFLGEGGRLYAASGKRGLVRIDESGEPDTSFAEDIVDDTAGWTMANVVGGFDADSNRDVFGHAQTLLCFNPQRSKWDTPVDISGKITGNLCAMVPVSGGLLLAANDGTTIRLYTFNSGTGMTYEVFSDVHLSQAEQDILLNLQIGVRADTTNNVTAKIFTNGETSTASYTKTIATVANKKQHLATQRPNVRGAKSHQIYLSQLCGTGDAGPDFVRVSGEHSNII